MDTYTVDKKLFDSMVTYLWGRPFGEVAPLFDALKATPPQMSVQAPVQAPAQASSVSGNDMVQPC